MTGKMQTTKIGELSEGQKSRLVFAMICMKKPNLVSKSLKLEAHKLQNIDLNACR